MTSLQIKPNVSSWKYANVSNFFTSSRNMQLQYANTYGFSTTDSDIHMSKNSEWGAVAYLSQSKYGKYGNEDYEGANKEIYQNKSSNYITGSSNGTPGTSTTNTQITYDVEGSGTGASTTGNITGIYDMSGGAREYVMGVLADANGNPRSGYSSTYNSGFNGMLQNGTMYTSGINFPDGKYYDLYTTESIATACGGGNCYGHALSEVSGWYSDYAVFASSSFPWVARGGSSGDGVYAGVFFFTRYEGTTYGSHTARSVLVPIET